MQRDLEQEKSPIELLAAWRSPDYISTQDDSNCLLNLLGNSSFPVSKQKKINSPPGALNVCLAAADDAISRNLQESQRTLPKGKKTSGDYY